MEIRYISEYDNKMGKSVKYMKKSWRYAYKDIILKNFLIQLKKVNGYQYSIFLIGELLCIENGKYIGTISFLSQDFKSIISLMGKLFLFIYFRNI